MLAGGGGGAGGATEGHTRGVKGAEIVDRHHPRPDTADAPLDMLFFVREDRGAEGVAGAVGQLDGVSGGGSAHEEADGREEFFLRNRHVRCDFCK